MTRLKWDQTGERIYETGVDRGVLYKQGADGLYTTGVPWNGLTGVTESPSGAEPTPLYADNMKYLNLVSAEEFGGTIEAYTWPDEFDECNGTAELSSGVVLGQQARSKFGFAYRTIIGNDIKLDANGYKLHLVYGALASPSEKAYATVNDSPEAITFSFEFTTSPVEIEGFKPTAVVTIDSTKVDPAKLKTLEDTLWGTEAEAATLPTLSDLVELFDGDGTEG